MNVNKEMFYLSCPCCNRLLFRYEGTCNIEIRCNRCNKDIGVRVKGKQTIIYEKTRE